MQKHRPHPTPVGFVRLRPRKIAMSRKAVQNQKGPYKTPLTVSCARESEEAATRNRLTPA